MPAPWSVLNMTQLFMFSAAGPATTLYLALLRLQLRSVLRLIQIPMKTHRDQTNDECTAHSVHGQILSTLRITHELIEITAVVQPLRENKCEASVPVVHPVSLWTQSQAPILQLATTETKEGLQHSDAWTQAASVKVRFGPLHCLSVPQQVVGARMEPGC